MPPFFSSLPPEDGGAAPSSDCSCIGMRTILTSGARLVCERKLSSGFSIWKVSSTLYGTELDSENSSSNFFLSFSLSFAPDASASSTDFSTRQLKPVTPSAISSGW